MKKKKNNKDINNNLNVNEISAKDMESLNLLSLQLKGILIDFYAESLLWSSTIQGIQYILEKYDGIDGNEHTSTFMPDMTALQASYTFLAAKMISLYIGFTRYNIVSEMKARGTFNFSLQPNIDINTANVLNMIVSYYYIRAFQGIVNRDNIQPIFGL